MKQREREVKREEEEEERLKMTFFFTLCPSDLFRILAGKESKDERRWRESERESHFICLKLVSF